MFTLLALLSACSGGSAGNGATTSTSRTTTRATTAPNTPCGRGTSVSPGTTARHTLRSGGRTREYLLHVPRGYRPGTPAPVVLVAHGHGGRAARMAGTLGFDPLADRDGVVVVYPQGLVGPDGLTGWSTFGRRADARVDDVRFVGDLLDRLQTDLCIDPARVSITGVSNGGGLTNLVACRMADRVAAAAPVAGAFYPIPGGCTQSRPVPLLEVHGTADTLVPYGGNPALGFPPILEYAAEWARRDACTSGPTTVRRDASVTTTEWSKCRGDVVVQHVAVAGAPHGWPGRGERSGFDTTTAVWEFFRDHARR